MSDFFIMCNVENFIKMNEGFRFLVFDIRLKYQVWACTEIMEMLSFQKKR